jgi:hypothetical protein
MRHLSPGKLMLLAFLAWDITLNSDITIIILEED